MMLADVPVPDHAVEKLASCCRFADADELADRLERALDDGVSLLALTIDGIEVQNAVTFPVSPFGLIVESKVTAPLFTGTEYVKNHGQYVKAMGGGEVAAQKCAGMPLNSTQGK